VKVEPQGASVRWEWTGSGITATAVLSPNCVESAPKTGRVAPPPAVSASASLRTIPRSAPSR
jgi:hypothetical protein